MCVGIFGFFLFLNNLIILRVIIVVDIEYLLGISIVRIYFFCVKLFDLFISFEVGVIIFFYFIDREIEVREGIFYYC